MQYPKIHTDRWMETACDKLKSILLGCLVSKSVMTICLVQSDFKAGTVHFLTFYFLLKILYALNPSGLPAVSLTHWLDFFTQTEHMKVARGLSRELLIKIPI